MKMATLFSGIGSPEQAAMRVYDQVEHIFACEIDKFARQSFQAIYNMDEAHFHQDIYELNGTQYQDKVDILVGGSPCQAFSLAGLRKGVSDKRGQLIYEYIRIVDEVKAPIIIYENVKGIMSIDNSRTIKNFIQALRDIGYYCHYEVLNTKDYGVPQNRERLFLVGFLDHEHYYRFKFASKIPLGKRLKDILENDVDEKFYLSDKFIKGMIEHKERHIYRGNGFKFEPKTENDISTTLQTAYGSRPTDTYLKVNSATSTGYETATLGDSINLSNPTSTTRRGRVGKQVAQTLDCACNQAVVEPIILDFTNDFSENKQREYTEYSPCLRSGRFGIGVQEPKIVAMRGRNPDNPKSRESGLETVQMIEPNENGTSNCLTSVQKDNLVLEPEYRIRKLTPLECWRLQDFPDEAFCKAQNAGVSNSQLYKQAGNSMSVNILEMIFKQIEATRYNSIGGLF